MNTAMSTPLPAAPGVSQEPGQFLTFSAGGDRFALGIGGIREIVEYGGMTAVPMMPDCVPGVVNLRGAVVPVIDLALRVGRPAAVIGRRSCIVVVELRHDGELQAVGVLVDAVHAVIDIAAHDIEPPPSFGASIRGDFITGMGKVGGQFIILLNRDSVLSGAELGALAAGLEGT